MFKTASLVTVSSFVEKSNSLAVNVAGKIDLATLDRFLNSNSFIYHHYTGLVFLGPAFSENTV